MLNVRTRKVQQIIKSNILMLHIYLLKMVKCAFLATSVDLWTSNAHINKIILFTFVAHLSTFTLKLYRCDLICPKNIVKIIKCGPWNSVKHICESHIFTFLHITTEFLFTVRSVSVYNVVRHRTNVCLYDIYDQSDQTLSHWI